MQYPYLDQTTAHDATSFNSSAHIEFPQLVELTQKLCVLEDSGSTQPIVKNMGAQYSVFERAGGIKNLRQTRLFGERFCCQNEFAHAPTHAMIDHVDRRRPKLSPLDSQSSLSEFRILLTANADWIWQRRCQFN